MTSISHIAGARHIAQGIPVKAQSALLSEIVQVCNRAPLFTPVMPRTGKPFSVRMSNCGSLGWVSDKAGYRYQSHHPVCDDPWPAIPDGLLRLWFDTTEYPHPPEACLINIYDAEARMGLHVDNDEEDEAAPVLSVSLGDTALFRIGGTGRRDPTQSFKLASGDIVVLEGASRFAYHGIDRIYPGTSHLLRDTFPRARRINLTLRRVNLPN